MALRIYADENNKTEEGKYKLNITGSLKDIEQYKNQLRSGMRVIFNVQNEFEVEGVLDFDPVYNIWLGQPDYTTKRNL